MYLEQIYKNINYLAINNRLKEIVIFLIDNGANVNFHDKFRYTPLNHGNLLNYLLIYLKL